MKKENMTTEKLMTFREAAMPSLVKEGAAPSSRWMVANALVEVICYCNIAEGGKNDRYCSRCADKGHYVVQLRDLRGNLKLTNKAKLTWYNVILDYTTARVTMPEGWDA